MNFRANRMVTAVALCSTLVLGNLGSALAGQVHAESMVYNILCADMKPDSGVADCTASTGPYYNHSHEQMGNNFIYGNLGSGHAHHHFVLGVPHIRHINVKKGVRPPPVIGSAGTSEYVSQTWVPDASATNMVVTWSAKSFLQVDPAQLSAVQRSVSARASLTTNTGLSGSVELSASLDARKQPQTSTRLLGAFKDMPFDLVKHPGGIVSLQFRGPVTWTVHAVPSSFDIALDGSVDAMPPPKHEEK